MNAPQNYTGTKICDKCLDKAITSYVFINRIHYIRNRLDTCVTTMVENLDKLTNPENKVFIEISQNGILPIIDDDNWLDIEDENIDESKLKVHVLEDEFRLKSDSESETETVDTKLNIPENLANLRTCAKVNITKDETKLVNGYQSNTQLEDVCSEFLTFKKKPNKPKTVFKCKFTCPLCSKYFISHYFLKLHVKKHINKKIECKICKQQFKSKFYLFEHKKMMHLLNNWNYCSCKTCGRTFTSENKMIEHEKCHQTKECQFCFKKFISQLHYDNHIQRHATKLNRIKQNTIQTCSFCEKEYPDDNELSVHVNKVHLEIKPYGCDMCEGQFYIDSDLRNHKKLHSMRKIEKCQFCMKTLRCRKDLVIHLRKHMEIQPFKCLICPQAFYSELASKNHMRKWHGGCYCCRLCKKVFVNQKGLQRHVSRAHSVF